MLSYQNGSGTYRYQYDAANQLTSTAQPGTACVATGTPAPSSGCVTFTYDANGNESKRTFPGGASQETVRDASARPIRIRAVATNGTVVVDMKYTYEQSGSDRGNI